jgi:streptogramin lyase
MRSLTTLLLSLCTVSLLSAQTTSWRYYRLGNTGIQGDWNESIWLGPDGDPWIGGYDPSFEEGGVAKFVQAENRWINVSNVDYPVIGHPEDVGCTRVSDMVADGLGNLWMGTWRGALRMNLAAGPSSLVKFTPANSGLPGGLTRDVTRAPDGTLWFSAESTSWGGGGLTRYNPPTNAWTHMDGHGGGKIAAQAKPGGGYYIWTALGGFDGMARWDSTTLAWTTYLFGLGQPAALVGLDSADEAGNVWMTRWFGVQGEQRLDCMRSNGTWVSPPLPPPHPQVPVAALRAFGNLQALMVDGYAHLHRFNGTSWTDLGPVPHNGFIDDLDIDAAGNVWLCGTGTGGALRRDALTGVWQRYRITNTSQFDNFNQDVAIDAQTGDVYACANASPGIGGMVKFDGQRWTGFVNDLGYGLSEPWPVPLAPQSEAVYVRPSNGHVVANPINNFTHEYDGTTWTSIPGGPDQVEQYVEDSFGRLWGIGHYGGLGIYQNGGFTTVDTGGWGGRLQVDPERPGTVWANEDWKILRTDGAYTFSRTLGDFPELIGTSPTFGGLAADHGGVVWVGCSLQNAAGDVGGGLLRIDADTGAYTVLKYLDGWPLPGQYVYPWKVTPDGKVWMMYEGGTFPNFQYGLCWYDGTNVGVYPAPLGGVPQWGGLPHAAVDDVELRTIPGGYELWMSCLSRGLAVLTVLDPAAVTSYGCGQNPSGSLVASGQPALGTSLQFALDNPLGTQAAGALPLLALSVTGLANPCGLALPGWHMDPLQPAGELLVGQPLFALKVGAPWGGAGSPASFSVSVPNDPDLIGVVVYAQGALVDTSAGVQVGLSEARRLRLGM